MKIHNPVNPAKVLVRGTEVAVKTCLVAYGFSAAQTAQTLPICGQILVG